MRTNHRKSWTFARTSKASDRLDVTTSSVNHGSMNSPKRATIYLDPHLHKALRLEAVQTDRTISDLVNHAVRIGLAEDAEDLAAFEKTEREPSLAFEDVLEDLRRRGKL